MRYNKRLIRRAIETMKTQATNLIGMTPPARPTGRVYEPITYYDDNTIETIAVAVFRVRHTPSPTRVGIVSELLGLVLTKQIYTRDEMSEILTFLEKHGIDYYENRADGVLNIPYSPQQVTVLQYNPSTGYYEKKYIA